MVLIHFFSCIGSVQSSTRTKRLGLPANRSFRSQPSGAANRGANRAASSARGRANTQASKRGLNCNMNTS